MLALERHRQQLGQRDAELLAARAESAKHVAEAERARAEAERAATQLERVVRQAELARPEMELKGAQGRSQGSSRELARPELEERAASAQLMHARQLEVAEMARRAAEAEVANRELLKARRAEDAVGAPQRIGLERGGGALRAPLASLALGDLPALPPAESSDDDALLQPTGSDGVQFGASAAGAPSSHVPGGRPAAAGLPNMLPPRARLDGMTIMSTAPPGAPRSLASPPQPSHPLSTRGSAIGWAGAMPGAMPLTPPSPGMPEEAGDVVDLLAACNAYVDNIVAENQRMRSKLLSCRSRQSTNTGS